MRKTIFASDQFAIGTDDQTRFSQWRDIYTSLYGDALISRLEDQPFASRSEFIQIGDVGIARCEGTFERYLRTPRHAAADTRGDFMIGFLRGGPRMLVVQRGRERVLAPGDMTLYTNAEAYESRTREKHLSVGLCIPRARLLERVANVNDLVITPLDPDSPIVAHLGRYLDFLLDSDEITNNPRLAAQINETLLDLVALMLGASGDSAGIARKRGLRAARVQDILADINARFADQAYSPYAVASRLGVSPRYVQDLLQEAGTSFTERVMELRLQKARAMLASPRHDSRKVSDIAYACGFSNVSYFNQRFRARFGCSPTQYRGGR